MHLEEEKLRHFITLVYNRAVALHRYSPDIWIEYAHFKAESNWEEAVQVLKQGLEPLGSSSFYQLACCDFYEEYQHMEEAERHYESFVSSMESSIGWIQYMYFARRTKGIDASRLVFRRARLSLLSPELFIAAGMMFVSLFI